VDLVGDAFRLQERAEIHAGFTVGSEAHDFPFVGVGSEAERNSVNGRRMRPRESGQLMVWRCSMRPCCPRQMEVRFPGAAAVHDDDGGIVQAGVGIGADWRERNGDPRKRNCALDGPK